MQAVGTSERTVPFWLRANKFGSTPSPGRSGTLIGRLVKDLDSTQKGKLNWGAGFEGRLNAGNSTDFLLIEGYAKIKRGSFQLMAGRTKDVMGLNADTSLSSGNFAISGNALGIPKVELSIPNYTSLGIFDKVLAIKGNFSHGWVGNFPITPMVGKNYTALVDEAYTFLHQKSFYVRFGKDNWKWKAYGGFNHQVFWGNEKKIHGAERFKLSTLETFFYVATGKTYGNADSQLPASKIGNQLGSIDLGVEYQFKDMRVVFTRQNFYDVGALSKLANIKDGLNSLMFENLRPRKEGIFSWKRIMLEFLYSKNQAGQFNSKYTKSGDEDYYNNSFYPKGWSYFGSAIGSPMLTTKNSAREGLASHPADFFINNRVVAFHTGFLGGISSWSFLAKASYSLNYGTFGTSKEGHSTGEIIPTEPIYGLFGKANQFSGFLSIEKKMNNLWRLSFDAGVDRGQLLYNSSGILLRAIRSL